MSVGPKLRHTECACYFRRRSRWWRQFEPRDVLNVGYHRFDSPQSGRDDWRSGSFRSPGNFSLTECVQGWVSVVEDQQLIESALAGNSAAFGDLVRKYQDRLYNTMTHLMGSPQDAQDVVQDAFVKAFVKLETFQRSSEFYTWLYRIAFNTAMSHQRRRRPTESVNCRQDQGQEPLDPGPAPGDRLDREELAEQVRMALKTLSDEYRTVLVLRDVDGCSYGAIAEMLEVPLGTIRSRLFRARMQLRDELRKVLQPDST
jgi:RNA polymerase sigma-70 factor, ECF subfamily